MFVINKVKRVGRGIMSTLIFFGNYIKVCPVLVEQELLTLLGHPSSPQVFSGVRVTQSLVLCVCFVVCPFVLFLLAIVLSVLLRLMDSDYSFGIIHSLPTIYFFFISSEHWIISILSSTTSSEVGVSPAWVGPIK